jgi:hypothetical protein
MHYVDKLIGFNFDLPDGWHYEQSVTLITFLGPKGKIGFNLELIQIQVSTILPQFLDAVDREKFLAETDSITCYSTLGEETNVVELIKSNDTEISAVHKGIHYIIAHSNDKTTLDAVKTLKETFRFPIITFDLIIQKLKSDPVRQNVSHKNDSSKLCTLPINCNLNVISNSVELKDEICQDNITSESPNESNNRIFIPILRKSYDFSVRKYKQYTPSEMNIELPKLKGLYLSIDYQTDIDGPQTATRLVRETLSKIGVIWVDTPKQSNAIIWIQGGSDFMKFVFAVVHPEKDKVFIAAESGPRELTACILTAVSKFFNSAKKLMYEDKFLQLIANVNNLNQMLIISIQNQDWFKTRQLMTKLKENAEELSIDQKEEAIKPLIDILADSAIAYEGTGFVEARELIDVTIESLGRIGKKALPWIKRGQNNANHYARLAFNRAYEACRGKPWWKLW